MAMRLTAMLDLVDDPTAGMARLGFTLPDFTRIAWVDDEAADVWQPRIARVCAAWGEIEWRTVVAGVRSCAVTVASPQEFLRDAPRWASYGLAGLPVEIQGISRQPYQSTAVGVEPGGEFVFRFVVGRPAEIAAFSNAWGEHDQEAIGALLGYPACCREFFRRVWVDAGMVDTTWPMAVTPGTTPSGATTIELGGPPQANILWRWMGVRAVSHLPCAFDCAATVRCADEFIAVGREAGYGEEMDWLLEILSWPAQWSALHGIAEIKTPVLRASTRTDATACTHTVNRTGTGYPAEGARGVVFPYRTPSKGRLTGGRAFRRGLANARAGRQDHPAWYATDNGFSSPGAMDECHLPIVALATRVLGDAGACVIDLGCGNGALAAKLAANAPAAVPHGVDIDAVRIEHARRLVPAFAANFRAADLFDCTAELFEGRRFALALLMPGRLLEVDGARAASLASFVRDCCDALLVYGYGDWLERFGDLAGLARAAELDLAEWRPGQTVSLANFSTEAADGD